jgi:hypothetical protein
MKKSTAQTRPTVDAHSRFFYTVISRQPRADSREEAKT